MLLDGDHLRARAVTGLEGFGLSVRGVSLPRTLLVECVVSLS
jgi:hypothetical protein